MYLSTQKFPQIFLYMSTTCCESFKSFREVGKSIFISNFYDLEISSPAKNSMILTAPYSEVSSALTNLFYQSYYPIYREHVQKSLNVNDTWSGFYSHFKKGTFALPYGHHRRKWVKARATPPGPPFCLKILI